MGRIESILTRLGIGANAPYHFPIGSITINLSPDSFIRGAMDLTFGGPHDHFNGSAES
jgi:hypothetical protein